VSLDDFGANPKNAVEQVSQDDLVCTTSQVAAKANPLRPRWNNAWGELKAATRC